MTEIQQNRWDQLVRRAANIVAGGAVVDDALSELFPVLDVENMPGEMLLLAGTRLCVGSHTNVPGALNNPRVQLFNPAGSGILATVSTIYASAAALATIQIFTDNTPAGTATNSEVFRDRRLTLGQRPACNMRFISVVGAGASDWQIRCLANELKTITDGNSVAVLAPGSGITVSGTTINSNLVVTFHWRERTAEPSELSF